jgi:hypothetical protein
MAITMAHKIVRSDEPVWAPAADEVVMLSVEKGKYYGLNDIAAAIWERIEQPIGVGDLCDSLQRAFHVSREMCEADVLAFLDQLLAKGLIRITD